MHPSTSIQPLVAIVLCTYNGEKYLRPQLDSILSQSWQALEIIICDDGSTDSTPSILQEYQQKDQRIRYQINARNLGYNKNFEQAFQMAKADYIAISDQDDIWESNKIAIMMDYWKDDSLFIFSLSGTFTDDDLNNRKPAPDVNYTPIRHLQQLVFNSPVHGHACIFRKELLAHCIPFPDDIYYDWWMSMHAARLSVIPCVPQTLTWHRLHAANNSKTILSLTDRDKRNQQLRKQFVHALQVFLERTGVSTEDEVFLDQYNHLAQTLDGKKISWPLFRLILRNRDKIFHYKKKKPLLIFSQIKHALQLAKTGVL